MYKNFPIPLFGDPIIEFVTLLSQRYTIDFILKLVLFEFSPILLSLSLMFFVVLSPEKLSPSFPPNNHLLNN